MANSVPGQANRLRARVFLLLPIPVNAWAGIAKKDGIFTQ